MKRAEEVHIHLIAEADEERAAVEADLVTHIAGPALASFGPLQAEAR